MAKSHVVHDVLEFLEVDESVSIFVGLGDHDFEFLVGDVLTQLTHDFFELEGRDVATAIEVKHLENLDELVFSEISCCFHKTAHSALHELHEFFKLD